MRIVDIDWNLDLISLPTVVAAIGISISSLMLVDESTDLIGQVGVGSVEGCGNNICLVKSWRWRCHLEGKETWLLALIPTDAGRNMRGSDRQTSNPSE